MAERPGPLQTTLRLLLGVPAASWVAGLCWLLVGAVFWGDDAGWAGLAAFVAAWLAPWADRGRLRPALLPPLGLALLLAGGALTWLLTETALASVFGPAAALDLAQFVQAATIAGGLTFAVRTLAVRHPAVRAAEAGLVALAIAVPTAAHRHGAWTRPLWLTDRTWRLGIDAEPLLLGAGAIVGLVTLGWLALDRSERARRALLGAAAGLVALAGALVVLALVLSPVVQALVDDVPPEEAEDSDAGEEPPAEGPGQPGEDGVAEGAGSGGPAGVRGASGDPAAERRVADPIDPRGGEEQPADGLADRTGGDGGADGAPSPDGREGAGAQPGGSREGEGGRVGGPERGPAGEEIDGQGAPAGVRGEEGRTDRAGEAGRERREGAAGEERGGAGAGRERREDGADGAGQERGEAGRAPGEGTAGGADRAQGEDAAAEAGRERGQPAGEPNREQGDEGAAEAGRERGRGEAGEPSREQAAGGAGRERGQDGASGAGRERGDDGAAEADRERAGDGAAEPGRERGGDGAAEPGREQGGDGVSDAREPREAGEAGDAERSPRGAQEPAGGAPPPAPRSPGGGDRPPSNGGGASDGTRPPDRSSGSPGDRAAGAPPPGGPPGDGPPSGSPPQGGEGGTPPPDGAPPSDGTPPPEGAPPPDSLDELFPEGKGSPSPEPVAIMVLDNDHLPPDEVFYLRQEALSRLQGFRLMPAEHPEVDRDVIRDPVDRRVEAAELPPADGRAALGGTIAALIDMPLLFAPEAPVWLEPRPNGDPARFVRAWGFSSLVTTLSYEQRLGDRSLGAWSPAARALYLQTPPDPRYAELATTLVGSLRDAARSDPLAVALAVTQHVGDGMVQDSSVRFDPDSDQAAAFLFGERRGYCVHAAHASVWLLRAAGFPARVGTGYAVEASSQRGSNLLIRALDAHAWPEVWLDQRGWTVVDVHAAESNDPPPPPIDDVEVRELGERARNSEVPQDMPALDWPSLELPRPNWQAIGRFLAGLAALSLVLLLSGHWLLKPWRRLRPSWSADARVPYAAYVAALDRLAEVGLGRQPGESREAHAGRLAAQVPSLAPLARLALRSAVRRDAAPDRRAIELLRAVRAEIGRAVPWWRRLLGLLDPTSVHRVT